MAPPEPQAPLLDRIDGRRLVMAFIQIYRQEYQRLIPSRRKEGPPQDPPA
jgi:hypothetical protein